MKKFVDRILHPKKTKLWWLYLVVGILMLILGIMLMPVWGKCPDWVFWKDWGMKIVNLIICACIVAYLVLYLVKKIRQRANGVVKVLTIIEFVILTLIAIGCVLQQFKVINVGGACAILGLALWCRGVVEIFRAYYHQHGNNEYYPVWWLAVAIFLVSIGVYMFVKPFFQDIHILWIFVVLVLLLAIILIVDGILAKPVSKKAKKDKKEKKQKSKEKEEK